MRNVQQKRSVMAVVWLIAALIVLAAILYDPVHGQGDPISVCRDDTYPTLRFEFRNIPASWFIYDSGAVWGYWAGGVTFDADNGAIVADPLQVDTDGYLAGTAVVVDYDNDQTAVGDALTLPCAIVTPPPTQNAANGRVEPLRVQPISNPVVSVVHTCWIKYPQIILVCNGVE